MLAGEQQINAYNGNAYICWQTQMKWMFKYEGKIHQNHDDIMTNSPSNYEFWKTARVTMNQEDSFKLFAFRQAIIDPYVQELNLKKNIYYFKLFFNYGG